MKKISLNKTLLAVVTVAALGLASYALAQNDVTMQDADLILSADACRQLAVYQPGKDGDAAYQPGVDVTGKPVVEADVGGAAIPVPEVIEFQLSADMAQYLDITTTPRPEGYIGLGTITILPDGRVLRDGQPLETQAEASLRALCNPPKTP